MVVDDVPEDRVEIRRLLLPPGAAVDCEVIDVSNAMDALKEVEARMPDCILMDHDLAETSGLALLREIIMRHGEHACGFVMLTASESAAVAVDILKAGAHDFLLKGRTTSVQLRKAVHDAVEKAAYRYEVQRSRSALERKNIELAAAVDQLRQEANQRRHVEEALRKSERQFRNLADNISQLAWMTDATGAVQWYNRRWFDYTGTTLEEMRGWGWRAVHHPEHEARVVKKLSHCFANGLEWEDTFPLRRHDGVYRWFLSRAVPIHDSDGVVLGWFGTNTDITAQLDTEAALKSARDKALLASRAKDDFLAALSHELRTPLNPVLLTAGSRAVDPKLAPDVREDFISIRKNVALEARLIDDLLDLTRITRGKLSLNRDELDLREVLDDALRIVRAEFEDKQQCWKLSQAEAPALVQGDAVRLRQVLWNVLKNAAKFTPDGGKIEVTLGVESGPPGRVWVEVIDSGIGMSPGEITTVFDAFTQGSHTGSTTHRFGGLGLGLAISRSIVEMHDGAISAHSDGADRGARFIVTLPLAERTTEGAAKRDGRVTPCPTSATAMEPPPAVELASIGAGYRLLLVEDHPPTRITMARLLRQRGFDVTGVGSRAEAHAVAAGQGKAGAIDGLLTDIGLPDGDGSVLLKELRQQWPSLQGIALSGYGMEHDVSRSRQNGFTQHLTKPIEIDQLDRALVDLVARMTPC